MRKKLRIFGNIVAAVLVVLLLFVFVTLLVIQTNWFREQVRQRVIAAVQEVSGGRVELGGFTYRWETLSATFSDFVVHGTEPPSGPPLFRAASVDVHLRILSAFERRVAVSSLVVTRPQIYVIVRPDGSTNVPSPDMRPIPGEQAVEELLNLKLRHFELKHGSFQTELTEFPLNLRSEDTAVLITYSRRAPSYEADISSPHFVVRPGDSSAVAMSVKARLRLAKNTLAIESSDIVSASSSIHATGSFHNFARAVTDLKIDGDLAANDLGRMIQIPELRAGRVTVNVALHRDSATPFKVSGHLTGRQLSVYSTGYELSNCELNSQIAASPHRLSLTGARFTVPWGQLSGDATLVNEKEFSLRGRVSSVNVPDAWRFLFAKKLPWSGTAAGTLRMTGQIGSAFRNFDVETSLDVGPGGSGPPVSGHVEALYRQAGRSIDLANSRIDLPHTRVTVSGRVDRQLQASLDTTDFTDLQTLVTVQAIKLLPRGNAHFDGTVAGDLKNPTVNGAVALSQFSVGGQSWNSLRAQVALSSSQATLNALTFASPVVNASGSARVALANWSLVPDATGSAQLTFQDASIPRIAALAHLKNIPIQRGSATGSLNLRGKLNDPLGSVQIRVRDLRFHDQRIDRTSANLDLRPGELGVTDGTATSGSATLRFSGAYAHQAGVWEAGQLSFKADSNAFPVSNIALAHEYEPAWGAQVELHVSGGLSVKPGHIDPTVANGTVVLRRVTNNNETLGDITLDASTRGDLLYAGFAGDLRGTNVKGNAEIHLVHGSPAKGTIEFNRVALRTLYSLLNREPSTIPVNGFFKGSASFNGPLEYPEQMQGDVRLDELQVGATSQVQKEAPPTAPALVLRNDGPIQLHAANGRLALSHLRLTGPDTNFSLTGSVGVLRQAALDLHADGTLDLKLVQLFQPELQATGRSELSTAITGTLAAPLVEGSLKIQNGSLFATGFVNGLTAIDGDVRFDRERATIQKLTAQTGGGTLSVGGFVDVSGAGPWIYRLDGSAENVRLRYANSISVTANARLRLTGTSAHSVLFGTATVSRVVFTPNADVGTLLASTLVPTPTTNKEGDFVTGLQLDIRVGSAPDLQVTTELSRDVQAEIDLRLRGSPSHPVLLGDIVANQGDIKIFGGKYSINRGEIRFVNAARIEPVLDLDLQTVARGITVDVTIAGTLGKLNINYRSDPPLQPRDIIALLTVGRAPDTATTSPNVQSTNDVTAMQYGANSVLGQAISPVSNRISKLFGITNIKIDPLVQGITNAPQARLTVEQQISREITVTYVTNLSQTSEQIFRVEWSFSPQYSLVALRDDNGEFGIDIQYKKRFK